MHLTKNNIAIQPSKDTLDMKRLLKHYIVMSFDLKEDVMKNCMAFLRNTRVKSEVTETAPF